MKGVGTLIPVLLLAHLSQAQNCSLPELLQLSGATAKQFVQSAGKKGYRYAAAADHNTIRLFHQNDSIGERYLIKATLPNHQFIKYHGPAGTEYETLVQAATTAGFSAYKNNTNTDTTIYWKDYYTLSIIRTVANRADNQRFTVIVEKRTLPRVKDITFAEDLLTFDTHHHLEQVFGKSNVSYDEFLASDGRKFRCSVLYGNTRKEAIFLWKDEENMRRLHAVRVGGNRQTSGAIQFASSVIQNSWTSRQGIYPTMTINHLQQRNNNPVKFYGWGGGANGNLCAGNSGNIDFDKVDLELSCLNCADDEYWGKTTHSSTEAIQDSRRIFVATMIFYPTYTPYPF